MRLIGLPAVAVIPDRHALTVEERSDAEYAAPVVHCLLDVGYDVASLADLAEKAAHSGLAPCESNIAFRTRHTGDRPLIKPAKGGPERPLTSSQLTGSALQEPPGFVAEAAFPLAVES